jgi:hypothetical protein
MSCPLASSAPYIYIGLHICDPGEMMCTYKIPPCVHKWRVADERRAERTPGGQVAVEERTLFLANMCYEQRMIQAEIAGEVGYFCSAVSRLLLEGHRRGIVEIRIHLPLNRPTDPERMFRERFGLRGAYILA